MKKNLKSLLVLTIAFSIIFILGTVNAATVVMKLDSSSTLKAGDIVEVTLKISSINAGDGIDAIKGTLEYDKNVFEEVTDENFEGKNKWNINIYDTTSQIFTVTKSSKVNAAGDILTISLKAKETVNKNSTTITIKDITASGGAVDMGGTGDIVVQNAPITISKAASEPTPPSTTNEVKTNEVTTNETSTNTISQVNTITKNPDSANGKLPQTGENAIGILTGISIVTIITIIAFIKYRNLNIK